MHNLSTEHICDDYSLRPAVTDTLPNAVSPLSKTPFQSCTCISCSHFGVGKSLSLAG
eukprot:m.98726 g.98726  ORF g.98726 m.98726 type:complete len:57 (+) comp12441_c0_seq2:12-182(+)